MVWVLKRGTVSPPHRLGALRRERHERLKASHEEELARRKAAGVPLVDESGAEDEPLEEAFPDYSEPEWYDEVVLRFVAVGRGVAGMAQAQYNDAAAEVRDLDDASAFDAAQRSADIIEVAKDFVGVAVASVSGLGDTDYVVPDGCEALPPEALDIMQDTGVLLAVWSVAMEAQYLTTGKDGRSRWLLPPT